MHLPLSQQPAVCPECGSPVVRDPTHAELVCTRCGLVVAERLPDDAPRPERPRVGAIPARRVWGPGGRAARDRRAPRPPRGLREGRHDLNRMADALNLPSHVAEDAFRLFRGIHRRGRTQGRRREAILAACIVHAARDRGVTRTLARVARAAGIDGRSIGRAQRALATEAGQRVLPDRPARLLTTIADQAGVPPRCVPNAARRLAAAPGTRTSGRRPEPLAAAALALACREAGAHITVAALARAAGVSRQSVHAAMGVLALPGKVNMN